MRLAVSSGWIEQWKPDLKFAKKEKIPSIPEDTGMGEPAPPGEENAKITEVGESMKSEVSPRPLGPEGLYMQYRCSTRPRPSKTSSN